MHGSLKCVCSHYVAAIEITSAGFLFERRKPKLTRVVSEDICDVGVNFCEHAALGILLIEN